MEVLHERCAGLDVHKGGAEQVCAGCHRLVRCHRPSLRHHCCLGSWCSCPMGIPGSCGINIPVGSVWRTGDPSA